MMHDELEQFAQPERSSFRFRLLDFLPGGNKPQAEETAVAGIILGALLFVWLVRRGFASVLNK